jgi:hypothetical protein
MQENHDTITVSSLVTMTTVSLQTIVANAKALSGPDAKGHYRVDTAEIVNRLVSKFLLEKNFEGFVSDTENYRD